MSDDPTAAATTGTTLEAESEVRTLAEQLKQRAALLQTATRQGISESDRLDNRIKDMRAREETEVRKFVTRTVISGYGIVIVGSILLVVLLFLKDGIWPEALSTWLRDLLLATVLPIVTLVLGYYFGSSSK